MILQLGLFLGRMGGQSRYRLPRRMLCRLSAWLLARRGIEIRFGQNIGEGLVLAHGWGITVNSRAVLGKDCVLFKGCTIGSVRSGPRKGVPRLGDRVVVGCNAFVCGGIRIGDDVLVVANAFVDFDVPSHSVVIGNPGVIHHKTNPCRDYLQGERK